MEKSVWNLEQLLRWLSQESGVQPCVLGFSKIFREGDLAVPYQFGIHSMPFCNEAKKTARGLLRCLACKERANRRSVYQQKPFCGTCANGLFEIVRPVVVNGRCLCIIYLGNLLTDRKRAERKVHTGCRLTGVNEEKMLRLLSGIREISDPEPYWQMAELIESYIRLSLPAVLPEEEEDPMHWVVHRLKNYADRYPEQNLTLQQIAKACYFNEKYAGRLFCKQTGMTFHEYLNDVRLKKAEKLLRETDRKVLQIAMDSGFGQVSYFNRVFAQKHGESPSAWRKREEKS